MEKNKEFLFNYLNAFSPVGNEKEGQKIWLNYIKDFVDEVKVDSYGTAWGIKKSKLENPKKVVIEAHCDEIAWMITRIESDGFIRVTKAGGSDNMIAPSKKSFHTHKFRRKNTRCLWITSYTCS